ncbi:response regulator, partial [uncultured Campylobacter sp.]
MSKILLVEDDETLCDLIGEYLKDAGFDVCVCSDAQSAADLAYEQKFDLFIFD